MASPTIHAILWTVFALFSISTGYFFFLSIPKPSSERGFHYITGAICLIASVSYYSMAGDYGVVVVGDRAVYYAR